MRVEHRMLMLRVLEHILDQPLIQQMQRSGKRAQKRK